MEIVEMETVKKVLIKTINGPKPYFVMKVRGSFSPGKRWKMVVIDGQVMKKLVTIPKEEFFFYTLENNEGHVLRDFSTLEDVDQYLKK